MNLNLRKKILLPSLCLFLLLMGSSFGITYYLSAKSLDEKASRQLMDVARSRAELLDIWVEDLRSLAQSSALRPEYEAVLKTDTSGGAVLANTELAEQVKIHNSLSYINIADSQGVVRASSIPAAVGKVKVGDRGYFKQAMQGKANVSDVYIARTTGKPAFAVAAPVRSGEKVIGVLVCVPDLVKFSERIIDPVKVFDSGYAAITDTLGAVFAHPDKSLIMKLNLKDHDFGREMLSTRQGLVSYSFQDKRQVAAVERCATTNWLVLAAAPRAEIVRDAHEMAAINGLIFLSGLIATILVLYLVSKTIVAPIDRLVAGLSAGASQVAAAAAHVSAASQELAEGASEQAASIEETSSSLEEMSSMTAQNAQNADVANNSMNEATNELGEAQISFTQLNDSMKEIAAASDETQRIIKTIDEIAFQTNLLALNAAVEAARAGESGAGFAVVADEVRNLAMRAAEAAKNTAALIEGTAEKINAGSKISEKNRVVIDKIASSALKTRELIGEIAAASREQAQGINQISKAVSEMDKVVQQNAANSEETASASQEMNAQSEQMKGYVRELVKLIHGRKHAGK